jgi:hypothetical protein
MSYCPIQAGTARNFRISPFLHIPGYQDGHFVKLVNPNDQEASAVLTWRNEDGDKTVQTETVGAFGGKRIMPPASLSTRSGKVDLEVSSSVGLVGMGFFGPTALIPPIMTGRSAMEAGLGGMTSEMADIFNREIEPALVSEAGGAGLTVEDYSITTDFDSRLASLMDSGLTEAQARAILESGTVGDLRNALREAYGQQTPEGLIPLVSPASFSITFEADGAGTILPFAAPFNFLPELAGRTAASAACYKMQAGGGLLRYGDYASSASLPQEDGAWCLLTENGRYLRPTDVVEEGRSYRIKLYIADNGPYDNNDQVGIIADPFTVGISEDQPAQTSGGGGGAVGCFVGSAAE